jgi:hypothetical protein
MDPFRQTCTCGRTFPHLAAFKNHQNKCKRSMSRLSIALAKAKEVFANKKQLQLRTEQPRSQEAVPLIETDDGRVSRNWLPGGFRSRANGQLLRPQRQAVKFGTLLLRVRSDQQNAREGFQLVFVTSVSACTTRSSEMFFLNRCPLYPPGIWTLPPGLLLLLD